MRLTGCNGLGRCHSIAGADRPLSVFGSRHPVGAGQGQLVAGSVIPSARSEAACQRGWVVSLMLNEWKRTAGSIANPVRV